MSLTSLLLSSSRRSSRARPPGRRRAISLTFRSVTLSHYFSHRSNQALKYCRDEFSILKDLDCSSFSRDPPGAGLGNLQDHVSRFVDATGVLGRLSKPYFVVIDHFSALLPHGQFFAF